MHKKGIQPPYMGLASGQVVGGKDTSKDDIVSPRSTLGRKASPLDGQQFGHYTLIRQLGQGGYASVYLGVHHYLNTNVALKLLNLFLESDEEVKRFQMEARMLALLRHRHVVRVLDFGGERGTPYQVMEYAPGGNLQRHLPQGVSLSVRTILPFVVQIASALQYIHNQGLIHRDVKPENLLVGPQHEIWLSDFGIALTTTAAKNKQFDMRELEGSAHYMAPEQLSGNPLPASDQYALAVMVYQWLCGQYPFQGTRLQICLQHLSTPPTRLRDYVASISPAVERVVLKALCKDPYQRFAHVQEFAYALKQANRR
jgi:serine/threonine protein kinase